MGIFTRLSGAYGDIWRAIIRPPRDLYTVNQLGLPLFHYKGHRYFRRDFSVINYRGHRLQCSHFERVKSNGEYLSHPVPCVIYLHGNCSSRLETLQCGVLRILLPLGVSVACFDFSGSGISGGQYISLGWFEKWDVKCVIEALRNTGRVSTIALWGRSMGAVTASLLAHEDHSIAGIVLDSPFASLRSLVEELASDFLGWKIPKFLLLPALNVVRNTILAKASFDLDDVEPIRYCNSSFAPALFIAAKDDNFVRPHHAQDMHNVYGGDKNMVFVEGNHNTVRPEFLYDSITIFLSFCLQSGFSDEEMPLNRGISRLNRSPENLIPCKRGSLSNDSLPQDMAHKKDGMHRRCTMSTITDVSYSKTQKTCNTTRQESRHATCSESESEAHDPMEFVREKTPRWTSRVTQGRAMIDKNAHESSLSQSNDKPLFGLSRWVTTSLNMTPPDPEPTFRTLLEHRTH